LALLTMAAKVIELLAHTEEGRSDISQLGGVGLLLKLLRPQQGMMIVLCHGFFHCPPLGVRLSVVRIKLSPSTPRYDDRAL
jgi:hypothetical protein